MLLLIDHHAKLIMLMLYSTLFISVLLLKALLEATRFQGDPQTQKETLKKCQN